MKITDRICAITSYYNPSQSKRRLENYKIFAKNINLFLICVELSKDVEHFELTNDDADIYVKIENSTILWHKESLLNIALKYVPKHIEYIVWVDCDIIFKNINWAIDLPEYLNKFKIVQLFSKLYDITKDNLSESINETDPSGYAIAYLYSSNKIPLNSYNPITSLDMRSSLFGLAWASKKDLITKHGFYDAMIIGSGDRSMFCAALGEYGVVKDNLRLNEKRFKHYLDWAIPFQKSINKSIGYLDEEIIHLWHGEIKNRKYLERHIEFANLSFDPFFDIVKDKNGTWNWNKHTDIYQSFLKDYFLKRQEH